MAWWGTLLGGTLGYMFGGPLGALLGAALGRNFDRGIKLTDDQAAYGIGQQERVQAAFWHRPAGTRTGGLFHCHLFCHGTCCQGGRQGYPG